MNQESTAGVQELIQKIKSQGVEEGRQKADAIIRQAELDAEKILSTARERADQLYIEAKEKITTEQVASQEAIKIAFRDSELELRAKFRDAFTAYFKKMVSEQLIDKDFIRQLILQIAGIKSNELASEKNIAVEVPRRLVEKEGATEEGKEGLKKLVLGTTNQLLREGVLLRLSEDLKGGIRVILLDKKIEFDLSDEAFSNLLLNHLMPRYRAIVTGTENG